MRKEERKEDEVALKALLESAPQDRRSQVRHILENLFPPAANVLSNSYYSGGNNDWFRDLRVCGHEVFDRYFQFSTPAGDISQYELDAVMALVGNREAIGRKFADLRERGLLEVALDRLDYYKDKLAIQGAEEFVTALFDLDVSSDEFFSLELGPLAHLQRILYCYLSREAEQSKRKRILETAIANTTGLFTPVMMIHRIEARTQEHRPDDSNALLSDMTDIDDLRRQAVAKIEEAAKSDRLAKEKELRFLLVMWSIWGRSEQMRQWVEGVATSMHDGVFLLLRTLKRTMRTYGGPIPKQTHYYRLSEVEQITDSRMLEGLINKLEVGRLSEEDAANVALFRQALDPRTQGKPDFDIVPID